MKKYNTEVNQISFLREDPEKSKLEKYIFLKNRNAYLQGSRSGKKIGYYYRNICVAYDWA